MIEAPAGFTIKSLNVGNSINLTYKTHGMGCMVAFILILPLVLGGAFLTFAISSPTKFQDFVFATWWTPICAFCGLFAIVFFLCVAMFNLFGLTEIIATQDSLTVRRSLWFWSSSKRIDFNRSLLFEQVKDGGEGEDSFPSWGLRAVSRKKLMLLSRQPIEKSDWLGRVLADHFDVKFIPATIRE